MDYKIIAVDFDGTCVTHEFPKTGKNIGAELVLKRLVDEGNNIICVSMRSEEQISEFGIDTIQSIKDWFKENDINLTAINKNPDQESWSQSRKIYAHTYIDDQFLGCPLLMNGSYSTRPFVDWYKVAILLYKQGFIENDITDLLKELRVKYPKLYMNYEYNNVSF